MEKTDRDSLKKIMEDLLQSGGYVIDGLKSRSVLFDLFREAQNRFFKVKGRMFLERPFSVEEHNDFVSEFASILKEFGAEIKKDILVKKKKRAGWVTSEVMKGAYGHQMRQPKDSFL